MGGSTAAAPHRWEYAMEPPLSPFSTSSPAPVSTERLSNASLPPRICELQATHEPETSTAAVHKLREQLRAIHDQLIATLQQVSA